MGTKGKGKGRDILDMKHLRVRLNEAGELEILDAGKFEQLDKEHLHKGCIICTFEGGCSLKMIADLLKANPRASLAAWYDGKLELWGTW